MTCYQLHTKQQPQQIYVTLQASRPSIIKLIAYDASQENSVYQRINLGHTKEKFQGKKTVSIKLPIAPEDLEITIHSKHASVLNIEQAPLDETEEMALLPPSLASFIEFAASFCRNASVLKTNRRYSNGAFTIDHLDKLIDEQSGKLISSPARIEKATGKIETNASIISKYTIPVLMFILLHEISHVFLETSDEFAADELAIYVYNGLGFPEIEAMYAFTKVFTDENQEQKRRKERLFQRMMRRKATDYRSMV